MTLFAYFALIIVIIHCWTGTRVAVDGLRVENLRLIGKSANSITIEWSVVAPLLPVVQQQQQPVDDAINSTLTTAMTATTTTTTTTSSSDQDDEWLGFKIKYFSKRYVYTPILLGNKNLRKFRLENLKSNLEYRIQVSAYNRLGNEGPASNLLVIKTQDSVPGQPQDLKAVKVTSNSIELEWQAPKGDDNFSRNVKGYEIHYFKVVNNDAKSADTQVLIRKTNDVKNRRFTLTDLEANSAYKIQVFGVNLQGDGQRSVSIVVTTLEDGPEKPENIRSEIHNDLLHIKWQPPASPHSISGYRLYLNGEKYELDGMTNQITLQRPKWEYDRQYEFRIAARSGQAKNLTSYGKEAVYRISTFTNQSKINIQLDKLTSTSVLIRWNNISLTSSSAIDHATTTSSPYYKLVYYLRSNQKDSSVQFDRINTTELQLNDLSPDSDYIVEIVAVQPINNNKNKNDNNEKIITSEQAVKHFRTLISNIEAPGDLVVNRYDVDKINVKWQQVVLYDPNSIKMNKPYSLIKGYRIYYREIMPQTNYNDDYEDSSSASASSSLTDILASDSDWSMIEIIGDTIIEHNLDDLNAEADYAIKVVAIDFSNNEGTESKVAIANRLDSSDLNSLLKKNNYNNNNNNDQQDYASNNNDEEFINRYNQRDDRLMPSFPAQSSSSSIYQINEKIGMVRDLEILEYTSTIVKFSWLPPLPNPNFKIKFCRISYVDRVKHYKESNGSIVAYQNGIQMSVLVPVLEEPTQRITWVLTSLSPNTEYDFNISAVQPNTNSNILGPPVRKTIRTRPDLPIKVDRPTVETVLPDSTVILRLGNASEKNGPISKYWLVVVPFLSCEPICGGTSSSQLSSSVSSAAQVPVNYERDLNKLYKNSEFNSTHPILFANESTYIAVEYEASKWPKVFKLGDGNMNGKFYNRQLVRGFNYRAYIVAFTADSSNREYLVKKQQQQQQSHKKNMLDLKDIALPNHNQFMNMDGDGELSAAGPFSEVFNTRQSELGGANRLSSINGIAISDYHNILWIAGAIASFIFIFILIVIVSLHLMNKKTKPDGASLVANGGRGQASATSSTMTTTTNLLVNNNNKPSDTVASINKMGTITTNTIKASVNRLNANVNSVNTNSIGTGPNTNTTHTTSSSASSGSSASSATASPTAALLSCSVNNNTHSSSADGTDSQQNKTQTTNTLTNLSNPNGLLTTASPLKTHQQQQNQQQQLHHPLVSESLYTSIEATQKLLQMNASSSIYDNNTNSVNQMMMMMLMNNNNNNNNNTSSTLTRNNPLLNSFGSNTLGMNISGTNNHNHHYDPIEFRRINYQTPGLLAHPPIHVDELPLYVERLKMQENAKFHVEYESIETGQQFQWENSILDINRQKNRYANVVAYDHSRVILTKLPPHAFQQAANSNAMSPSHQQAYYTLNANSNGNYGTLGNNLYGTLPNGGGYLGNQSNTLQFNNQYQQMMMMSNNRGGIYDANSAPLPPPPPPPPGTTIASANQQSPIMLSNCSDYINANYMDGYRKRNAYIATQGPLPSTFGDFWRMVWEQQTCTIVMLTKLEERNRLKCDQYWPNKGTEVYGNVMQVTLVDYTELATYSVRTFVISPVNIYAQMQITANSNNINFEMRREVKHFQFTAWPDHGVPDHPTSFLMFLRRVKQLNPADGGPIVAHCSAGVGRTGCYVVIDSMLERLKHEKAIDIYGHVTCLRAQRNFIVQTEDQYIFCYDAVLEASQTGLTEVPVRSLYHHLQRLLNIAPDDPTGMLTEMELEYKRLSNIKAPQSKFQSASLTVNKFKNRLVNILPYESTRVVLQHLPNAPEQSGTDYINANYIDGYKYKRAYIATQAPLAETVDDFWRMLWEHNSSIIVMLTKLREMGREKCAQYWPSERATRYQYFVVEPIAEYNMSQYVLREFKISDARDGQSRTVRQFQFIDWPEQGVPKSGEGIVELIGQVHKTKEQFGQTGPITVHCSAGVGRTGVFITLSIVLERMRYEGYIDVFNTVKVLRTQRPAMVQTEDQYQFVYRAALEYLGSFDNSE